MSKRVVEYFLFDAIVAVLKIEFVSSKFSNAQELFYNFIDWDSVIREFEIIGEAMKHLIKSDILNRDYQVIVDFRNYITHAYFGISQGEVWSIIQNDLINFKEEIIKEINSIDKELKVRLIDSFMKDNNHLKFIKIELKKLQK